MLRPKKKSFVSDEILKVKTNHMDSSLQEIIKIVNLCLW